MALFDNPPAGLLSPEIESQIRNQQMLSLGLGLLQGSGPSLTPTSFGQVLGNAGMQSMSQGESLRDRAIQQALLGRKIAQEDNDKKRKDAALNSASKYVQPELRDAFSNDAQTALQAAQLMTAGQPEPKYQIIDTTLPDGRTIKARVDVNAPDPMATMMPVGAPVTKQLPPEAALKLSNYQNALNDAKQYADIALNKDEQGNVTGFNDTAANMPEARKKIFSAVASKLRADSGATVTTDDVENELKKYGWSFFSSDKTNAQAVSRLLRDIENGVGNIQSRGGTFGAGGQDQNNEGWVIEEVP